MIHLTIAVLFAIAIAGCWTFHIGEFCGDRFQVLFGG